jgi:DNA-binding MarR family transcriptional regulator
MAAAELEAAARFRTELRRFHRATERVTSSEGLTPERYDLLLMIEAAQRNGRDVTVSSLREALQLPQQGVTETVKRAVQAGLVTREPSPHDGRVKYLRLTPEGERRLRQAFRALRNDRAAFAKAFDRLTHSFRATSAPTRPRRTSATR